MWPTTRNTGQVHSLPVAIQWGLLNWSTCHFAAHTDRRTKIHCLLVGLNSAHQCAAARHSSWETLYWRTVTLKHNGEDDANSSQGCPHVIIQWYCIEPMSINSKLIYKSLSECIKQMKAELNVVFHILGLRCMKKKKTSLARCHVLSF